MAAAIEVRGLRKSYGGRVVVDGLSFEVAAGACFALLGPNGAGKTTTVEVLEGYRRPDGGAARVLGLDPRRERRRLMPRVGIMLQQGGLYPQTTPREALRLFASFYPSPRDPDDLLEALDLGRVASTRFRRLSGGERQRLALGIALVGRPELVFLDEPTASMDAAARRAAWAMLSELHRDGTTVFLTTHFIEEAERLADRVAIMSRGRLVALGPPDELRRGVGRGVRLRTASAVDAAELGRELALPVEVEPDGALLLHAEPTPQLVATITALLADRDVLVEELRTGGGSLEQAFLELTAAWSPPPLGGRRGPEADRREPRLPGRSEGQGEGAL